MSIPINSVFNKSIISIVSTNRKSSRALGNLKFQYKNFIDFMQLEASNIENIKLPKKDDINKLANMNITSTFGKAGNLLQSLVGGALDISGFLGNMFLAKGGKKISPSKNIVRPKVSGSKLKFGGLRALRILNGIFAGLDFVEGLKEGEGIGKAASGAAGSLAGSILGASIGATLGSAVPIVGTAIGGITGSMLGGFAGGWLADRVYDSIAGYGETNQQKLERKLKEQNEKSKDVSLNNRDFKKLVAKFNDSVDKFEKGMLGGMFGTMSLDEDLELSPSTSYDNSETQVEKPGVTYTAEGGEEPSSYFSSGFGWRKNKNHNGVDFAHPIKNIPVTVIQPGVVDVGVDAGGWGNYVAIKHDNGAETLYGHLSKVNVRKGQKIESGTVIGNQGSTGRSTGPHVHFEYRPGGPGTKRVDGRSVAPLYFRFGGTVTTKRQNSVEDTNDSSSTNRSTNYPNPTSTTSRSPNPPSATPSSPLEKGIQGLFNVLQRPPGPQSNMPTEIPNIATNNMKMDSSPYRVYTEYNNPQTIIIGASDVILSNPNSNTSPPVSISMGESNSDTVVIPGPSVGEVAYNTMQNIFLTKLSSVG
jgi:murein DD-endopeptidase MepM/ murein hydrolase activator NlpD